MSFEGVFLGMGNPLLDISANVDQAFLDKYGLTMNNAILAEEKHMPIFKDMIDNLKVEYIAGGATQNTVRVTQWMLQEKKATSFIGCVGKDDYAKQLTDCVNGDGVQVLYQIDEKAPTGKCATLIMEHERSLCTDLQAANNYKIEHFESEEIQKVVKAAKFVYIAGFFLTVSPPTIQKIGKHCNEEKKIFAMNLSAPFIPQFITEPLMAALPLTDIIFGNESEAAAYAEKHGIEDKSTGNIALVLSKLNNATAVITHGPEPTAVAKDGKVSYYPVPKLADGYIVDANGAGDAFVGGYMAALIKGKNIEECCNAGNYAAGVILGVSGSQLPKTAPTHAL